MLNGTSSSQSKIFVPSINDSLIPEDNIQAILQLVEKALKEVVLDESGTVLTIDYNQKPWQFMVCLKADDKKHKKIRLKNVDLYVLSHTHVLGEGSQGKVILAQHVTTGRLAAAKIQTPNSPSFDQDLAIERRNLSLCERLYACGQVAPSDEELTRDQSSNISDDQLECLRFKATTYYTLMKHFQGKSLNEYLYDLDKSKSKDSPNYYAQKRELDILSVVRLSFYAMQEVDELHARGLVHRDIKSENYVVNTLGFLQDCIALRLIDLGTALLVASDKSKDDASTFGYMPPEYLVDVKDRVNWDITCDKFQLGMVLAELLTKYNYQAGLKKHAQLQEQTGVKRHLTFAEIQELMPDIFVKLKKPKNKSKDKDSNHKKSATETEIELKDTLYYLLLKTIQLLTHPDRNLRESFDLKQMVFELRSMHVRASTLVSLNNPYKRFQEYKMQRQNTASALPKLLPASTSSSMELPTTSTAIPKLPLQRRKSVGNLKLNTASTLIIEEERPSTERIERSQSVLVSRKRSISSSANTRKTIKSSATSSSVPDIDLSAKLGQLLISAPDQDQVIEKLVKVSQRLDLLLSQVKTSPQQGSISDFMIFSLLGQRLTSAISAPTADKQHQDLIRLGKMVSHYQKTDNTALNQEMDIISKTLANYPK